MIDVVAALIIKDNKILLAKRSTGDNNNLGKWEFPGGKVNKDEDEKHALEREIKEEFELDIKTEEFLTNNICKYPNKEINLKLYKCKYIGGEFRLHDHSEYKFVSKKDLLNYDLSEADIPLAQYVKNNT